MHVTQAIRSFRVRLGLSFLISQLYCLSALAAPVVGLHYRFQTEVRQEQLTLHVRVHLDGLPSQVTSLQLPVPWGDFNALQNGIQNLRAESAGSVIMDTDDPSLKLLKTSISRSATITYDLKNNWDGHLREDVRHLVHLEPTYVEISTNNALIHPVLAPDVIVKCSFDWRIPSNWSLATSFDVQQRSQQFHGTWDKVKNAVFVAGDFRLHEQTQDGGRLVMAFRGAWRVSDQDAEKKITNVFRMDKAFWNDHDFPYYLVTVVPFDGNEHGISGGDGYTNAFSIHTASDEDFSLGLLSLFTHELFHAWNPYKLGFMPQASEEVYWFTEGFTTYYQYLLLWRNRVTENDVYLEEVNQILKNYYLSPVKNISLAQLIENAQNGQTKDRISYDRGATIALWLDLTIRRASNSERSLDSVMQALLLSAQKRKHHFPTLTSEYVLAAMDRFLDASDRNRLRSYVQNGSTVELPESMAQPCALQHEVDIPSFDIGMSRDVLVNNRVVKDLRTGSEAQKAGIQEGDKVVDMSIYWDDIAKLVELKIQRNGTKSWFKFHPIGVSLGAVPQFVAGNSQDCETPLRK